MQGEGGTIMLASLTQWLARQNKSTGKVQVVQKAAKISLKNQI